jgi:hypothetical protein
MRTLQACEREDRWVSDDGVSEEACEGDGVVESVREKRVARTSSIQACGYPDLREEQEEL